MAKYGKTRIQVEHVLRKYPHLTHPKDVTRFVWFEFYPEKISSDGRMMPEVTVADLMEMPSLSDVKRAISAMSRPTKKEPTVHDYYRRVPPRKLYPDD